LSVEYAEVVEFVDLELSDDGDFPFNAQQKIGMLSERFSVSLLDGRPHLKRGPALVGPLTKTWESWGGISPTGAFAAGGFGMTSFRIETAPEFLSEDAFVMALNSGIEVRVTLLASLEKDSVVRWYLVSCDSLDFLRQVKEHGL